MGWWLWLLLRCLTLWFFRQLSKWSSSPLKFRGISEGRKALENKSLIKLGICFALPSHLPAWLLQRGHHCSYRECCFRQYQYSTCAWDLLKHNAGENQIICMLSSEIKHMSLAEFPFLLRARQMAQNMNCSHECRPSLSAPKYPRAVVCHIFLFFQSGGNSSKPHVSILQVMDSLWGSLCPWFSGLFSFFFAPIKFYSGFAIFKMFSVLAWVNRTGFNSWFLCYHDTQQSTVHSL